MVKNNWPLNYEVQVITNGTWIPLEDLVASEEYNREAVARLSKRTPQQLLWRASEIGEYNLIKWAIERGADIAANDNKSLYLALINGHEKCVRLLVNRGNLSTISERHIQAAISSGNAAIWSHMNPFNDKRISALLESASSDYKEMTQNIQRYDSLEKERKILEEKLSQMNKSPVKDPNHIPHRPTCGSPNVSKIPLGFKGIAALLFGVLSIGYAAKSFRCRNCGYSW